MEVNIRQALKIFFSKSSFEMIYFEAFANALDADATDFCIDIRLRNSDDLNSLVLTISDNGLGFDDIRFGKFSKLFDVEEQSHKGLGRLVYLCYFDKVLVTSVFNGSTQRKFEFNETFNKESDVNNIGQASNGSIFEMTDWCKTMFHKNIKIMIIAVFLYNLQIYIFFVLSVKVDLYILMPILVVEVLF